MMETAERHPNLVTWLVLAIGMIVVLAWSAREVVLSPSQWFWLAVATVLLAGLCAWIISWEADETDEEDEVDATGAAATEDGSVRADDQPESRDGGSATAATAASADEPSKEAATASSLDALASEGAPASGRDAPDA